MTATEMKLGVISKGECVFGEEREKEVVGGRISGWKSMITREAALGMPRSNPLEFQMLPWKEFFGVIELRILKCELSWMSWVVPKSNANVQIRGRWVGGNTNCRRHRGSPPNERQQLARWLSG